MPSCIRPRAGEGRQGEKANAFATACRPQGRSCRGHVGRGRPLGLAFVALAAEGPSAHEFVIIRSDEEPGELPVDNGLIPEDQVDLVDEAEDIAPGTNTTLSVNLAAGSYVLVCNLPGHYEAGVYAGFTVA